MPIYCRAWRPWSSASGHRTSGKRQTGFCTATVQALDITKKMVDDSAVAEKLVYGIFIRKRSTRAASGPCRGRIRRWIEHLSFAEVEHVQQGVRVGISAGERGQVEEHLHETGDGRRMVHLVRDVPGLGIRRDQPRGDPHAELAEVPVKLGSWRAVHRGRDVIEETAALVVGEDESRAGPQRAGGY